MKTVLDLSLYQLLAAFFQELLKPGSPSNQNQSIKEYITSSRRLNVLISDDDQDDRELFAEAIAEFSPHILISNASDGKELMDILNNSFIPDLIFLDLNMPRQNGFECLTEIRSQQNYSNLPILIYSTSANPDQIEKAYELGANLYIQKPDRFASIITMLDHIFSRTAVQLLSKPKRDEFVVKI